MPRGPLDEVVLQVKCSCKQPAVPPHPPSRTIRYRLPKEGLDIFSLLEAACADRDISDLIIDRSRLGRTLLASLDGHQDVICGSYWQPILNGAVMTECFDRALKPGDTVLWQHMSEP